MWTNSGTDDAELRNDSESLKTGWRSLRIFKKQLFTLNFHFYVKESYDKNLSIDKSKEFSHLRKG